MTSSDLMIIAEFSKSVKNNVGKGKIARYVAISPFPTLFSRLVLHTRKNQGLFEKGFTKQQSLHFRLVKIENICI